MKKLLFILAVVLISCSPESNEDCRCDKITYEYNQYTVIGSNGLPQMVFERVDLNTQVVPCQDEQEQVSNGDGTYYEIICE